MGFSFSRTRVSCFIGNRLASLRPTRSYVASTGIDGEPLRKNVQSGIDVTIMNHAAFWTYPFAYIQRKRFEYVLTGMTGLRGWIPMIDLDQSSFIPLGFVFELTDKLAPSNITDSLGKLGIFD